MSTLPIPYRIRCRGCLHPAKFHDANGCSIKGCNCTHFDAEELEHELCIDAITMRQICVQCSSDKNLENGLCGECRKKKKESQNSTD